MMMAAVLDSLSVHNTRSAHRPDGEGAVDERLRFLQNPGSWIHFDPGCRQVHTLETQMSWVFLGQRCVLKMKKPLKTAELDFSSLTQRLHYCEEEVRLNRRLAPQVYLGVMGLRRQGQRYTLHPVYGETCRSSADDTLIEGLVWMRKLPTRRMMHRLIERGCLQAAEVIRLGELLALFYAQAPRVSMDPEIWMARYRQEWRDNAQVLLGPWGEGLHTQDLVHGAWQAQFDMTPLLKERCDAGAFVEGHGDLRPEHVYFAPHPLVIDALEFNVALRRVDPVEELDYLAMECQACRADLADDVGPLLWRAWQARTPARCLTPPHALRHFYRLRKALLRARLCLLHLTSPCPRTPARWRPLAHRYLSLARQSLKALQLLDHQETSEPPHRDQARRKASDNKVAAENTLTF